MFFNHPDFTLANLSVFPSNTERAESRLHEPSQRPTGTFLNPQIFNGGSRRIEFGIKLSY